MGDRETSRVAPQPIRGSRVVVTGAAGGIGRALAERFVTEGARVVVADRAQGPLTATADELGVVAVSGDLATEVGVAGLVEAAVAELGGIDVWCGNAGIGLGQGIDAPDRLWQLAWDVNVQSHVRAARHLLPLWLEQGHGRLVVTASAAGLLTMLGDAPYSVTKHAAVSLVEWLAATYGDNGIVAQAVCPEGVRTALYEAAGPLQPLLDLDGTLEPADVAEAVVATWAEAPLLVLPHPEVARHYAHKAAAPDVWIAQMRHLQRRIPTPAYVGSPVVVGEVER
ncbi:dehydrogenase [Arsenicicoccus piscis]|uniref:Dehydrogenase n=1 Tax=Arsenicicoccus piscis TaxID=673954 RepID=A0ABQ6HTI1_9MICO|nr:dehydrogenase [Arsenicicoccus piscis]